MQKIDSTICERITKQNEESQNKSLRLFAKVDIPTRLEILSSQKQLFHKLKKNYQDVDNAVLTLSSLVLAVDLFQNEVGDVNIKAIKLRAKNKTNKIKREKLLSYWSIVKTLKLKENYSYREISNYFVKYHKFEISYSLIYQMWNEIENNKEVKNEDE